MPEMLRARADDEPLPVAVSLLDRRADAGAGRTAPGVGLQLLLDAFEKPTEADEITLEVAAVARHRATLCERAVLAPVSLATTSPRRLQRSRLDAGVPQPRAERPGRSARHAALVIGKRNLRQWHAAAAIREPPRRQAGGDGSHHESERREARRDQARLGRGGFGRAAGVHSLSMNDGD